jgi:hypothetical protein
MAKPTTPKLTPEQSKFVLTTQGALAKKSGRTPSRVLKTFYPAKIKICGYEVSQCGLGILGLLEQIGHPFIDVMLGKGDREVSIADQQRAFFIFAHPRTARDLLAQGPEALDVAAYEFTENLNAAALGEITAKVAQLVREGLATMPGVDLDAKASGADPLTDGGSATESAPATPA